MKTMKSITSILPALLFCLTATAQTPVERVNLQDITFVRQNFDRNIYNDRILTSRLNLQGTDLFLENSANLIIEGDKNARLSQESGRLDILSDARTTIRVGAFHPYFCYEADFKDLPRDSEAGIRFYSNDGSSTLTVSRQFGALRAELDGRKLASSICSDSGDLHLRVQYTGARFHVFELFGSGKARLLMSVECDMRNLDMPVKWSWGIYASRCQGASLTRAESFLSDGTGQADPQVVQNSDGTPYIRDGRLYVCLTTRGFEQIPDSYQGVYSLSLTGYDLRLEGALFFTEGDGRMMGYHATKIVCHEGRFLVITTTHGGPRHTLAWAEADCDILHGIHCLECRELDYPHKTTEGQKYGSEDPDFFFDAQAGKWRLGYCALFSSAATGTKRSYATFLCESDNWNGPYEYMAKSGRDNNTGVRITSVGGRRYVLSGGSDTTFYIYDYPTLDYVGTFKQEFPNGGFRGWPTIVPVPYGNFERYLWITFDRGAITGKYSYGTLYFFLGDKMWRRQPLSRENLEQSCLR